MADPETAERATDQATTDVKPGDKPQRKRITRRQAVEQRVSSYFEAMARRDVDAMLEHWAEDGFEDMVPVGVIRGREELRKSLAAQFAAMPDMRTTVTRLVAGEHNCAVEWRIEGTFDGAPYMGLEPTGSHIELRGIDLIELEDGQITSLTAYFDSSSYARQIGLLPADGSGADRAMKTAFNAATKLRRAVAERRNGG
jgi:steroid delta-isomerase-like uncharacterized protein